MSGVGPLTPDTRITYIILQHIVAVQGGEPREQFLTYAECVFTHWQRVREQNISA